MNLNPVFFVQTFAEYVGSMAGDNIFGEFLTSFIEIVTLFTAISILVGFIKHALHKETYDKTLGKKGLSGAASGAILGILTPVCSCSVSGLYAGLVSQGASPQAAAAFLFAAPAVNEFALALMFQVAGWQGALLYIVVGFISATLTGYFSKYFGIVPLPNPALIHDHKHHSSLQSAFAESLHDTVLTLKTLLIPMAIGVAASVVLGKYLPNYLSSLSRFTTAWYSPILATAIGLPTHIEAASAASILLPIIKTGLPLGTAISLLMSVTISSFSEVVILRKIIGDRGVVKLVTWYFVYCSSLGLILNAIFR